MIVPWQEIPADSLQNLIEEFVSRDGTDYGVQETPLSTRVEQVRKKIEKGTVVIWYDDVTETISLFHQENIPSPQ